MKPKIWGYSVPTLKPVLQLRLKRQVAVRAWANTVNCYGSSHQASVTTEIFFLIR